MSFRILGMGKATPTLAVTNDDLSNIMDTNDEWITTRTGIRQRYICRNESLTDLAVAAGRQALEHANLAAEELDLILCSTVQGDYVTPSLACLVQQALSATCPAYDINAACTGFIYALDAADAYFRSGKVQHILVISAEMMSKHLDWNDRSTCVLFGDGAGAAVLSQGDGLKAITLSARGSAQPLAIAGTANQNPFTEKAAADTQKLKMQGSEVFKFAVSQMVADCQTVMDTAGLTAQDIKLFVPHQANIRIIQAARRQLKLSEAQTATNIDRYGNTSSATVPILLAELLEQQRARSGDLILLAAMGGGLTSGACLLEL